MMNPLTIPSVPNNQTLMSLQSRSNAENVYSSCNNPGGGGSTNGIHVPVIPAPDLSTVMSPTTVINMNHTSDVIIGPTTQYQGAVTIYQYMDTASTLPRPNQNSSGSRQRVANTESDNSAFPLKKYWIPMTILAISVLLFGVSIYLMYFKTLAVQHGGDQDILFGRNYESGTIVNLGNGHLVIDRLQWGAQSVNTSNIEVLHHPIPYVLITHIGVQSTPCNNIYKCSVKLRTMQDAAIAEKNLTDLPNNFYIGNDGNIYVGRGWNITNHYGIKSLSIGFLGDYVRYKPESTQFEGLDYLLAYGISNNLLSRNYKLIAHNQTKSTRSPGIHLYDVIRKYTRWYPCGMADYPQCGVELGITKWN